MNYSAVGEGSETSYPDKSTLIKSADPWRIGTFAFALVALLPVLAILWLAVFPTENIWPHLISTSLPRYLQNTVVLMLGVGVSVFLTGVSTAYFVSQYEFPLRRYFEWLLLLPLAFPAYVIAYMYTDLLEFAGPIQHGLRTLFGWQLASDYWFPNVRSMGGAIMLMGLVLYPYVYLMARASFIEQSSYLSDASRLMGRNQFKTFLFVSLPIARPAIAIGVALALMETLNDFGTVDFFSIHTLTAGLYDVWLNMGNLGGGRADRIRDVVFCRDLACARICWATAQPVLPERHPLYAKTTSPIARKIQVVSFRNLRRPRVVWLRRPAHHAAQLCDPLF